MIINFRRTDDNFYKEKELILPIVDLAFENEKYVGIVCEVLNLFYSYSEDIVNKITKMLKSLEFRMNPEEISNYRMLSKKIVDFYWEVVDDEFGKQARAFDQDLYYKQHLQYSDMRLNRYRGLLFENLLIRLVQDRFEGELFETGCQVYINNCRVIARYGKGNSEHKETIDVAGWVSKMSYGEFYECKISPLGFKAENYKYFVELISGLKQNKVINYIVGFVSADATEKLKAQKKCIEGRCSNCNEAFEVIGRENLYKTKFYRVPEIA